MIRFHNAVAVLTLSGCLCVSAAATVVKGATATNNAVTPVYMAFPGESEFFSPLEHSAPYLTLTAAEVMADGVACAAGAVDSPEHAHPTAGVAIIFWDLNFKGVRDRFSTFLLNLTDDLPHFRVPAAEAAAPPGCSGATESAPPAFLY